MYGWERRGGAFTDHFAESITDEDVRKALERTRRALIPDAVPNESGRGSVAPSETERTRAIAPATGDDANDASSAVNDDPDAASDDRDASREPAKTPRADQTTPWAEHKRAGAESFQRGAFRDAADRFARAARALAADAERNATETRVDAVTLAGLHSNVSAALLRAGDSAGAAEAAERCVAARPEWGKAHFRVGEAAFAAARFDAAREAYSRARECAENDAASGTHDGSEQERKRVIDDVAILERRIAACARAARGAAMCDEEESSLAAAAEARRLEAERKREASSDENVARLNAEAEDRERDPNARRLMREIEALFAEARKTTEETRDAAGPDPAAPAAPAASGEKEKQEARKRTPSPRAAPKKNAFPARAALRLLAELLSVEPENFEAAFQAAILSLRENRTLDAIAYARRCLARAPGFARAADFLATCLETTQEGGDRSRGDDAHRARFRVPRDGGDASVPAGELTPAPSESEAELALAMAVMSNPESPDAWTAFARHLARRGLASDAVAALRDALAGGPEGKWLRPRSDAALLTTLGFLLHLRGHVAEPASLYASAAAQGGGMVTATLAARVAGGDDDDAVSRARDAMRAAFAARAPETAPHLEALNVAFAAPQFEVAARKHVVAALLSDAGVENVAPPTLCWARGSGSGALGEPGASAGPGPETRERLFAGGRAAWLLKARRRAFEGAVREPARACPRVFACGSEAEALERLASAGVGPATATAQRYVSASAPATRAGRGVTLRLFATLVGPPLAEPRDSANLAATPAGPGHGTASATERERVFFSPCFAEGFVIRAAPRWLDARDDDDDADGDFLQTDDGEDFVVDVASAAEAETWANGATVGFGFVDAGAKSDETRRPMDWARAYASARRKAETYFRLADGTAWRERHGEMDARAAWRRARLPKLVETTFALDGDGEPWLVDVEPFPPLVRYASAARDGVGVALRHLARAHDLCD